MALSDRFNILAALGYPTTQDAAIELHDKNGVKYSLVADNTATGLLIEGGKLIVEKDGIALKAGRLSEVLTVVDDDTQNFTLAAADILAGINVHTSTSGAGTVTVDTGANIIAGIPLTHNGQCVVSYFINDGSQTVTFAVASGTTISDTGNTVLINESKLLVWRRVTSSTVKLYIV